ncbi:MULTISPECIES: hypothetical protein [Pseudanabaena]|uniref:Uncharacterized protein n=2 Tax=Pseudanabaena TaxID=1152 RepID=L8MZ01_9CYAN|nr:MULTISPECIES: hypothetical protein [Pseudanabaena]ELS32736.1 hypothetical protein Pse7429DRAFT_2301 [Pseudanabaena biceps PCC 7429]MDG3495024.1 hypothetical protein [Pseudanabaena catenata USMAC16]
MSKVLINSLIDEINTLLSRPVRSVSKKASPDTIHQREQLKQLRSHLEGLTDDSLLGNLEQQYQALVTRLQGQTQSTSELTNRDGNGEPYGLDGINIQEDGTGKFKTDKLETSSPLLVSPVVSNLFGTESNLTKENSIMTNGTPESNSFVNDRLIASLQQAIQQTLQQVVKESVQQAVSQTLAVERALMVGEISANLNKIVESQQRSQISQELITLNQQKQKLNAEISQLEADRVTWMRQFQEFQATQQEALDRSLQSVDNYVRDQISDSLQQTMATTVAESVNQTLSQSLQNNLANLSAALPVNPVSETPSTEFVNRVQEQTDRFLMHLDEMFNTTFRSLEQEIQGYQTSISAKLGHMETLEQKGEALINALVERIGQQSEQVPQGSDQELHEVDILPELPDDIPARYLETFSEPADENLIDALLAGDKFGETIAEPSAEKFSEPFAASNSEIALLDMATSGDGDDALDSLTPELDLDLPTETTQSPIPTSEDPVVDTSETMLGSEVFELESILGASSDTLFEQPVQPVSDEQTAMDLTTNPLIDLAGFGTSIILDPQSAIAARELNPDFDMEAATQIVETFDITRSAIAKEGEDHDFELLALNFSANDANDNEVVSDSGELIDNPELLQWLEETNKRPSALTNLVDVSADEDLLSWLGNEAIDMAKLPVQTKSNDLNDSLAEIEIFNDSPINSIASEINLDAIKKDNADSHIDAKIEQFFSNSGNDHADDSDESLILLTNKGNDTSEFVEWEDSLVNELSSDLAQLNAGGVDPLIAANLDQFIRNTPYSLTNWEAAESQSYPTIIEVSADDPSEPIPSQLANTSNESLEVPLIIENPNTLFIDSFANSFADRTDEQSEIVVDIADLQLSPFASPLASPLTTASNEIPEIFDNPDSLFEPTAGNESPSTAPKSVPKVEDDMDAIFAEVIAENAAKYNQSKPFTISDELDELFVESASENTNFAANNNTYSNTYANDLNTDLNIDLGNDLNMDHESDLDTLLFGFDAANELEENDTTMQVIPREGYSKLDAGAATIQEPISPFVSRDVEEELDTILQGFVQEDSIVSLDDADMTKFAVAEEILTVLEDPTADMTKFAVAEEILTVLEEPNMNSSQIEAEEDDWTAALDQIESNLLSKTSGSNKTENIPKDNIASEPFELSADEFFASLENDKLNNLADTADTNEKKLSPEPTNVEATEDLSDFMNLENEFEEAEDDFLLNEFADSQHDAHTPVADSEWDNLLKDLNSFNFAQPLLDERREQLGLSSVAPITDTSENVFDIDSLVLESKSKALIPTPPEKEVYSLDDTWILGVDFGSTAIRASLLNASTGRLYPLYLDDADEMLCQLVWADDRSLDDPIAKELRVLTKRSHLAGLENGEVAIGHFKQFLKLGLPYRGVSAWQPIIQWSISNQNSLRWFVAALKNLLEQIQTRANHPKLPDVGLILLKLSGVVFGYPTNWSDTYILNVREAILKAKLVNHAEQVMAVEQAIAPVLSLVHDRKISEEVTLLIDAGAITTSLCLAKGLTDAKDRSKLHVRSLDYAGISISQDIVVQLFYPHWLLITNPNRHLCNFDRLSLPEVGASAISQRVLLQQYLLSSDIGRKMLELADRIKSTFGRDVGVDEWNEDLMGQPIVVLRRELENLILQPFIQRLNRELNAILSNAGILGEDVRQVLLLGSTMNIPLLSRWLAQKLPNASIDPLATSMVANGLAVSPLYPHLQDIARQQYSDYFLLQEICRLNLTQSVNPTQLLQQLQIRGINIKVCRDRILSILQGDLPEGLFPWQESENAVILEDPTLSSELFAGRLFELETDGTYQPNVVKFQQLRVYLQAIIGNMSQTLNEPLVFPEIKTMAIAK